MVVHFVAVNVISIRVKAFAHQEVFAELIYLDSLEPSCLSLLCVLFRVKKPWSGRWLVTVLTLVHKSLVVVSKTSKRGELLYVS